MKLEPAHKTSLEYCARSNKKNLDLVGNLDLLALVPWTRSSPSRSGSSRNPRATTATTATSLVALVGLWFC